MATKKITPGTFAAAEAALNDQLAPILKALKKVQINATVYTDSRAADDMALLLSLSPNRKSLELVIDYAADGSEKYDIKCLPKVSLLGTSAKYRQAVILVEEPARSMEREVAFRNTNEKLEDRVYIFNFGVALPDATKYIVSNKKHVEQETYAGSNQKTQYHTAKVVAKIPASKLCFLVGYDEEHLFISCLPKKATSVEEAHQILLPKEVKGVKNYLRQGEFFFVPATQKELDLIAKEEVMTSDSWTDLWLQKDNGDSDHAAQVRATIQVSKKDIEFVTGTISNERHAQLFLNGWYKVVVNNEVPNPSDETTWD